MIGSSAVGIYGAAATLTEALWLIPGGVAQVAFRRASASGSSREGAKARRVALALTAAASLVLAALTPYLIRRLLGSAYAGAVPITYILIAASLPMASYQLDIAVVNGLGMLKRASSITIAGVVCLALACMLLIPLWGAVGAAWSSLASYTLMATLARRRLRANRTFVPE
jgi:O-antigen/teichoic acid export membrane protein